MIYSIKPMKKITILISLIIIFLIPLNGASPKITIKLATLAPEGSDWHTLLVEMGQEWKKATDGRIQLRIYPSGVVGDERDMVRKMRIGQIHAAAVTAEGLSELTPDVNAFFIPGLFESFEDVDIIRGALSDELEAGIEESGFKLLLWADVGWAYWFTKEPINSLEDLRPMKIFTWAGDYKSSELWEKAGYYPVPLASIDVLSGLQTGLVNAFSTTPLVALSMQWFGLAPYMLDVKWGLIMAGIVIHQRTWNKIPVEDQKELLIICKTVAEKHQKSSRVKDLEAINVMKGYGLKVNTISAEQTEEWSRYLKSWYPNIRGFLVPEEIFDKTVELKKKIDESRKDGSSPSTK